jgi:hypothetical protein
MENPDTEWTVTERRPGIDPGVADTDAPGQPVDPMTGTPRRRLSMARWRRREGTVPTPTAATVSPTVSAITTTRVRRVPNSNDRAVRVIRYVTAVLEIVLVIRFFLRLLGASPDAAFSLLVYGVTELLVAPFEGLFPHPGQGFFVFDSATAVAIVIYPLVAWALTSYIRIKTARKGPFDVA